MNVTIHVKCLKCGSIFYTQTSETLNFCSNCGSILDKNNFTKELPKNQNLTFRQLPIGGSFNFIDDLEKEKPIVYTKVSNDFSLPCYVTNPDYHDYNDIFTFSDEADLDIPVKRIIYENCKNNNT